MYRIEGQGRRIQAPDSRDSVFKFSFVGSTGLATERRFRDPNIQYNKNLWCGYGGSTTGFLVHDELYLTNLCRTSPEDFG